MKRFFKILGLSLICFNSKAFAENAPISVEVTSSYSTVSNRYYPVISVISEVDNIKVFGVTANRGNCEATLKGSFPGDSQQKAIAFGDVVQYNAFHCAKIREVIIHTDRGDWTYTLR
ncbi:hypothetical protein Q7526_03715 [Glaesserella parasuis]|uniref:hypothetical protein n=1 Tax=Glaesserella parasuis TaxID=738 RepID=UPI0004DD5E04|nr:hypothetical protein [Glaesserella parasuis]KEZ17271.1 hypothetical protein HS327_02008 [Glaesserella parasuis]MDG6230104.1 hypothetical protein [Glaesserella parasuis]MDO9749657.1 hypothetical protein [Glaesserella parasuis]MDO9796335.1 hypothetical protein [Glaesserella parasuis]MDP0341554.1 hypothetical protein [Glaesserella parasuis]